MDLETPEASTEVIETTLEACRNETWNRFQSLIEDQPNVRISLIPRFEETLHLFVHAHLGVLVDQYHYEEEIEPYEFIREKLLRIQKYVSDYRQSR